MKRKQLFWHIRCFFWVFFQTNGRCQLKSKHGNTRRKVQSLPSPCIPWLGWHRFGEFPRLVGRYCSYLLLSSRMVEHPKSKSTQPRNPGRWRTLYLTENQFSRKTYFYTCHACDGAAVRLLVVVDPVLGVGHHLVLLDAPDGGLDKC